MSLKLNPGCNCCRYGFCNCSDIPLTPSEYDVTFTGWSGAMVETCVADSRYSVPPVTGSLTCEYFNDTFTMGYKHSHIPYHGGFCDQMFDFYDPSFIGWRTWFDNGWWCYHVPTNLNYVCYWSYQIPSAVIDGKTPNTCYYEVDDGDTVVSYGITIYGFTLVRYFMAVPFTTDYTYLWRLIPHYEFSLHCDTDEMYDVDNDAGHWYWEFDPEDEAKCDFDGSETWTLFPFASNKPDDELSVTCESVYTADLTAFCLGTLTPSVVTG